ncbi:quinol:cytochrome C oxidoreductase [Aquimarina celericrescens]|uniref:Quinol:cytochrome C oxidoreductase n=1 Tax=Aquimarina celericrescens TaxID=1964542 RepID=A0ABW5B4F8_9FLAO|nr:quinol:cytochrome C oxidoreductase [Aquimarina celericrescens]
MYTLSNRLRLFSIILMVVGLVGLIIGFAGRPGSIEEVKEMMAAHDAHGGGHGESETETYSGNTVHAEHDLDKDLHTGDAHYEHILHQLQNKPWASLYVAAFFFFMIALGVLAFYAIQFAAQAGWSPVLFRVMEAITAYLVPGGIILFVILALSGFHVNHLFIWADPEIVDHDKLIQGKSSWLNGTGFIIRAAIFLSGWLLYRHFAVKYSRKQDEEPEGNKWYKKSFKISAGFLVFFIYTESMMSWDWIMSFDPHWFSTLFGWYVFASLFVSGITTIALITIYLKSKGYLEFVNDSHIHDLAKFMFGISIFWTYLWFSQFMLIWYSNIPEEVTYFITRIEDYKLPFFGMLVMNFIFPLLVLMNSDFKRVNWFVVMAGIVILCGHYIDVFNMVMPATVGESWFIGISEISAVLLFLGLFLFVVFRALTKAPLLAKGNPYLEESKHFHY